ncbi:hypothetical protein N4G58_01315 [Edwardsiella piscicida]|nr:hypothetical protein N4G58_01315 [Edwardsiella piscicida]
MKDFNPQIVHSHMYHANLFSRFLRMLDPSFKLICTAHNTNEGAVANVVLSFNRLACFNIY